MEEKSLRVEETDLQAGEKNVSIHRRMAEGEVDEVGSWGQ